MTTGSKVYKAALQKIVRAERQYKYNMRVKEHMIREVDKKAK